jgi:hypothetical protein
MSALNVIQQSAAVHLVSDGAGYAPDGTIVAFRSKLFPDQEKRCVAGFLGRSPNIYPIGMALQPNFDALVDHLGEIVETMHGWLHRLEPDETFEPMRQFTTVVAGWSDRRGEVIAFAASTEPSQCAMLFDRPEARPYVPLELPILVASPPVSISETLGSIASLDDIDRRDPAEMALALIEAQRRGRFRVGERDLHIVGGFADMASVTENGVTVRRLVTWPDAIGAKIDPFRGDEPGGADIVP